MKINADVIDVDMLKALTTAQLITYLSTHGWSDSTVPEGKGRWLNMRKNHANKDLRDLDVPLNNQDRVKRIMTLIDTVAQHEQRTILEVYCDMLDLQSVSQILHRIFEIIERKALHHAE